MFEWSDDDRAPVTPPPSTIRVEVQSKGGEVVLKQQVEKALMVMATRPLTRDTWVVPRAVPRSSGRQRRFRTIYREDNV